MPLMTNSRVRLRLVALGLAAGLVGALIVLVTLDSQKRVEEVRARLGQVDLEELPDSRPLQRHAPLRQ